MTVARYRLVQTTKCTVVLVVCTVYSSQSVLTAKELKLQKRSRSLVILVVSPVAFSIKLVYASISIYQVIVSYSYLLNQLNYAAFCFIELASNKI